jgi:hypothetical protein
MTSIDALRQMIWFADECSEPNGWLATNVRRAATDALAIAPAKFDVRDRVVIDGDTQLKAYVTAVLFRDGRWPQYEVSWVTNGISYAHWIEEFRLQEYTAP